MHVQVSTPFSRAIHTMFYYAVCVHAMWIDRTPSQHRDVDMLAVLLQSTRCQTRSMPDANQRLPQHNADHVPVRTYKEIGDAPEHLSFASHHQAACWTPMLHDAKCLLDLERPIISRVHRARTLWPRRHGQPPTIGPPEHNGDQPKPDLQDVRRWSI